MKKLLYLLPIMLQLLVGGTLFLISFWIEVEAFSKLLSIFWAALFLALALEIGKAISIFYHRYLVISSPMLPYPTSVRIVSYGFRLGLICLSFLSTLIILSYSLYNVQEQIDKQKQMVNSQYDKRLNHYSSSQEKQYEDFTQQQQREYQRARKEVEFFKQKRLKEMHNKVNGTFKGPLFKEFDTRYQQALSELKIIEANQSLALQEFTQQQSQAYQTQLKHLQLERDKAIQQLVLQLDTTRKDAHNPMLVSLITLLQKQFPEYAPSLPGFILFLALFIALLMELGIILSFENVALALTPYIQQRVLHQIERETLKADFEHAQETDAIHHENDLDTLRRKAEQAYEKGKTFFDNAA